MILTSANIVNTTNDTSKCYANTSNAIIKAIAATDAPRATSLSSLPGSAKRHTVPHMESTKLRILTLLLQMLIIMLLILLKILLIFR